VWTVDAGLRNREDNYWVPVQSVNGIDHLGFMTLTGGATRDPRRPLRKAEKAGIGLGVAIAVPLLALLTYVLFRKAKGTANLETPSDPGKRKFKRRSTFSKKTTPELELVEISSAPMPPATAPARLATSTNELPTHPVPVVHTGHAEPRPDELPPYSAVVRQ
jgi:hypothetical protein